MVRTGSPNGTPTTAARSMRWVWQPTSASTASFTSARRRAHPRTGRGRRSTRSRHALLVSVWGGLRSLTRLHVQTLSVIGGIAGRVQLSNTAVPRKVVAALIVGYRRAIHNRTDRDFRLRLRAGRLRGLQ